MTASKATPSYEVVAIPYEASHFCDELPFNALNIHCITNGDGTCFVGMLLRDPPALKTNGTAV
jgi:hypothetical protein